ncbi:MAG: OsmC family protein [Flavipsychrobacter sp.]|nr:OsmC family protein [Flavipsychrobacter sp.]
MKRYSTAVWNGSGKEGSGHLTSQSTTLNKTQYSYKSRFEDGVGTNPEELIAAAHAGCYTMKLSFLLGGAGFTPTELETKCDITLDNGVITKSELTVKGNVPNISNDDFKKLAEQAHAECLVGKLFNCEKTLLSASLA